MADQRPAGVGIAGAMDYQPRGKAQEQDRCFVCQGPFKGGASYGARVLPPMVQVCSAECAAARRFAAPETAAREAFMAGHRAGWDAGGDAAHFSPEVPKEQAYEDWVVFG